MSTALPDRDALVGQLLDQIGVTDAGLRDMLAARFNGGDATETESTITPRERQLAKALKRSERVNSALLAKIEMLACALGACPTCWGNDPECGDCGGDGLPGAMLPDPQCFERFVEPLLEQLEDEPDREFRPAAPRPRRAAPTPLPDAIDITPIKENGS